MTLAGLGPVLLVGAGRMGGALLEGWIAGGLDPRAVCVIDPVPPESVAVLASNNGLRLNPGELAEPPAVLVLAVKPQVMDEVLPRVAGHVGPDTLVVSIAAGRTIAGLARHLPSSAALVRAMPNTPAAIGRGITACVANAHATAAQRYAAEALMRAGGEVCWLADEDQMDAVTAVSGSGPAYVFLFAECLARAGREAGLPGDLARRLARATVAGAGELLHRSPQEPEELRAAVTSPGGTTAAALDVLMTNDALAAMVMRAVAAARRRSRELAG